MALNLGAPRTYCSVPGEFGKSEDVTFIVLPFPDKDQPMSENLRAGLSDHAAMARAAAAQHEIALAINRIFRVDGVTQEAYGEWHGLSERRIGKILRGEASMRTHELDQAKWSLPGLDILLKVRARRAHLRRIQAELDALNVPDN